MLTIVNQKQMHETVYKFCMIFRAIYELHLIEIGFGINWVNILSENFSASALAMSSFKISSTTKIN